MTASSWREAIFRSLQALDQLKWIKETYVEDKSVHTHRKVLPSLSLSTDTRWKPYDYFVTLVRTHESLKTDQLCAWYFQSIQMQACQSVIHLIKEHITAVKILNISWRNNRCQSFSDKNSQSW